MRTKTFLSIITALLIIATSIPMDKAESFENGFDGWETFTQAGGIVQLSTAFAHSGTHSIEQLSQSTGSTPQTISAIRLPVTNDLDQYRLSAWVYVTERTEYQARSFFGFVYGEWQPWNSGNVGIYVGWDVCATSDSVFWGKSHYDGISYGLTLNVWHNVTIITYTNLGTVSLWLDGNLIVDNYPSFAAGEKPTYYYIDSLANVGSNVAHHYIDDIFTSEPSGHYNVRLSGSGVIMDQSGHIVGWSARLTGTIQGEFNTIINGYGVIKGFWYNVEMVNLRFTWYRDPLGLTGRISQPFYATEDPLYEDKVDWLNGIRVDSATWRVNAQMLGPLNTSLSLSVRWRRSITEGRTGTITGKFKGVIPIPNTPYMFVPVGGFSYGVNVGGTAFIST